MDSNNFRKITEPNIYSSYNTVKLFLPSEKLVAPNDSYPNLPARMSDCRIITDYLSRCEKNIPCESQFPTTLWLQRNGDKSACCIRRLRSGFWRSRKNTLEKNGNNCY